MRFISPLSGRKKYRGSEYGVLLMQPTHDDGYFVILFLQFDIKPPAKCDSTLAVL